MDIARHNYGFYKDIAQNYKQDIQLDRYVGDLIDTINAPYYQRRRRLAHRDE